MLTVPKSTVISWESGVRWPSGASNSKFSVLRLRWTLCIGGLFLGALAFSIRTDASPLISQIDVLAPIATAHHVVDGNRIRFIGPRPRSGPSRWIAGWVVPDSEVSEDFFHNARVVNDGDDVPASAAPLFPGAGGRGPATSLGVYSFSSSWAGAGNRVRKSAGVSAGTGEPAKSATLRVTM